MKRILSVILALTLIFAIAACNTKIATPEGAKPYADNYRNFYEIFVYSFCDSDGDGIGDLNGVTSKLDYIEDLGYDAIWLMPIMPSTTYHKYDVIDYYDIDPQYGTMKDFENLSKECDKRGIKLMIELMLNHTSSENKWFKEALNAVNNGKKSKYIDYYNFVDTPSSDSVYRNVGVTCGKYYEAHFADNMPDLNFDNPNVKKEFQKIAKFWIKKGVDGFRLDAIKHVFLDENKNIELCNWFNTYCKKLNKDIYIVGEVWSKQDEILKYYDGNFTSLFNFSMGTDAGTIAYQTANGYGKMFSDSIEEWQEEIKAKDPDAIDALFLSNHDNNRIASKYPDETLLKAFAKLYMTLPGTIITYYGEEVGMKGEGRDENKRGPMDWVKGDEDCKGPDAMDVDTSSNFGSVEEQETDKDSIYNFYKEMLTIRNKYETIAKGKATAIAFEDSAICAYELTYNNQTLLIIHNFADDEKTVNLKSYNLSLLENITCKADAENTFDDTTKELTLSPYGGMIFEVK